MKDPVPEFLFDDENLALLGQSERDMDAGRVDYVMCGRSRMEVSKETMQQLQLVKGQTVSMVLVDAILKRNLLHLQQKLGENPPTHKENDFKPQAAQPGLSDGFRDDQLIALAAAERDMDAGRMPFVMFNDGRVMMDPQMMEDLKLQQGQTVNIIMLEGIMKKRIARQTTQIAIKKAQNGKKPGSNRG